jgi:hypothetical protein
MNTAPVSIVYGIETPTEMEPNFISEKWSFGSRTQSYILPTKTCYKKLHSSLIITFFIYLNAMLFYMALVSTAVCLVYCLSKKDPAEHTSFNNSKNVDEART